jgi:hypothetical protein
MVTQRERPSGCTFPRVSSSILLVRELCLLLTAAAALQAAVIRGSVVENMTGKPLLRTQVTLQPVPGTAGAPGSTLTGRFGEFEFGGLPAGSYIIKVSRIGFVPIEYGQRQWNAAGQAIVLEAPATTFLNLRMQRWGGIAGTVRDDHEVGMEGFAVTVFRDTEPPQRVTSVITDDQGQYRVGSLVPGRYLVRSASRDEDGTGYMPTFAPDAVNPGGARRIQVMLDDDVHDVDVRPLTGRLYTASGVCTPVPQELPISITLAGEMGRQTVRGPAFNFSGLSPGQYEVMAEAKGDPSIPAPPQGAYVQFTVRDRDVRVPCQPVETLPTRFSFTPRGAPLPRVTLRRLDLAGPQDATTLAPNLSSALLLPGRWEVLLTPQSGTYVSYFYGQGSRPAYGSRFDGWNQLFITPPGFANGEMSNSPGIVFGTVKAAGEPVPGAPVYLEGYDERSHTRVGLLRSTRTDAHGAFRFQDLAPGPWRVLATFEYRAPETEDMDRAGAASVAVATRSDRQMDLELWGIR